MIAKPKIKEISQNKVKIIVQNGVYSPAMIKTQANQKIELVFIRKDDTPCSEYVIFEKLNISKKLPVNQPLSIMIMPTKPGKYEFTCQMGMYRGMLIVV